MGEQGEKLIKMKGVLKRHMKIYYIVNQVKRLS